jgi:hypothetical protein
MVVVNDILVDGAFDDATKGIDYVLHIASPVSKPVSCLPGAEAGIGAVGK